MAGCAQSTIPSNTGAHAKYADTHTHAHMRWHAGGHMKRASSQTQSEITNTCIRTRGHRHTHTHIRGWALRTPLRFKPICHSLCLSTFQRPSPHMQMWTFPPDSLARGSLSAARRRHRVTTGLLSRRGPGTARSTSLLINGRQTPLVPAGSCDGRGHRLTLLWCSPGRWPRCPPGTTAASPESDRAMISDKDFQGRPLMAQNTSFPFCSLLTNWTQWLLHSQSQVWLNTRLGLL